MQSGRPLISLVFDERLCRARHADQFPEYIDAVMYEKTLNDQVHFAAARGAQIGRTLRNSVRTVAALIDQSFWRDLLFCAELEQQIHFFSYFFRSASGKMQ